jgi:hypothetical protein
MKPDESQKLVEALESIRAPIKVLAAIESAKEIYPDNVQRLKLVSEYRSLGSTHANAVAAYKELGAETEGLSEQQKMEKHGDHFTNVVQPAAQAVSRFADEHPLIAQLSHALDRRTLA